MTEAPTTATKNRTPLALGIAVAAAGFVVDQASKLWVLHATTLPEGIPIRLAPFLDLTLVWNRGISYGLLQQHDGVGRWLLVAFSVVAVAVMGYWLRQTASRLVAVSLALIIGGALGNMVDRIAYGAVVDFIYLHAFGFSWYVFNFADAWIVAGVVGLLYDSLRPRSG